MPWDHRCFPAEGPRFAHPSMENTTHPSHCLCVPVCLCLCVCVFHSAPSPPHPPPSPLPHSLTLNCSFPPPPIIPPLQPQPQRMRCAQHHLQFRTGWYAQTAWIVSIAPTSHRSGNAWQGKHCHHATAAALCPCCLQPAQQRLNFFTPCPSFPPPLSLSLDLSTSLRCSPSWPAVHCGFSSWRAKPFHRECVIWSPAGGRREMSVSVSVSVPVCLCVCVCVCLCLSVCVHKHSLKPIPLPSPLPSPIPSPRVRCPRRLCAWRRRCGPQTEMQSAANTQAQTQ